MRKLFALILVCVMVLSLAACGIPAEPVAKEAQTVTVANIDEFLAALGSDRTIVMEPGHYCLSDAADYGKMSENIAYGWEDTGDGYELVLKEVQELTVVGSGMGKTFLEAIPRQAEVLTLTYCNNVTFRDMTLGHLETAEVCEGSVFRIDDCTGIRLENIGLYGCGTDGVFAVASRELVIDSCHIYDCSAEGIYLAECSDVNICDSMIYDLGVETGGASSFLDLWNSHAVTVDNCSVFNSDLFCLVYAYSDEACDDVLIKNTAFYGNWVSNAAFEIFGGTVTMDNCVFKGNGVSSWYPPDMEYTVKDADGKRLSEEDFVRLGGGYYADTDVTYQSFTVSNIDEFLAALGSYRTITLEPGNYCLSDASDYGLSTFNSCYEWVYMDDGYELRLKNIEELTIIGSGMDETVLEALPRSAAVLHLTDCYYVTIQDMTIGHVEMAQACEGAVLNLDCCAAVNLENLGLYGCGTVGVSAADSGDLMVSGCHIYDCSTFGVFLYNCDYVSICDSVIDNIGSAEAEAMDVLDFNWCGSVTVDGCTISDCNVGMLVCNLESMGDIVIRNTEFRDNCVSEAAFALYEDCITVDNCVLRGNAVGSWYDPNSTDRAVNGNGEPIPETDFRTLNG